MKRQSKLLMIFSMSLLSIAIFMGCSLFKNNNPKVDDLANSISKIINLNDLKKADKLSLRKYYRINPSHLEEFALYLPSSNMDVTEIFIAKCKDQDSVSEISDKAENRVKKQGDTFKDYGPEQYSLTENHILFHKGNYVIMIVANNAEDIFKKIKDQF